jgi:hypothetical protein
MPLTQPMRRPTRGRRPGKILMENPSQEELLRAAEAARYVSSPYHRPPRSPMGPALHRPFPHASKCPTSWDLTGATRALKEAIRTGCVSAEWRAAFPRFAWYVDGEILYEAVLSNQDRGEYHAYPLESRSEWPKGL